MHAVRQFVDVVDNMLMLKLPEKYNFKRVEVVIMPADEIENHHKPTNNVLRKPSVKLKGTKILGDIMAGVPERDWEVLR